MVEGIFFERGFSSKKSSFLAGMAAADSSTNVVTVHCVVLFLNAKRKLVKPYFTERDETSTKVSTYFLIMADPYIYLCLVLLYRLPTNY